MPVRRREQRRRGLRPASERLRRLADRRVELVSEWPHVYLTFWVKNTGPSKLYISDAFAGRETLSVSKLDGTALFYDPNGDLSPPQSRPFVDPSQQTVRDQPPEPAGSSSNPSTETPRVVRSSTGCRLGRPKRTIRGSLMISPSSASFPGRRTGCGPSPRFTDTRRIHGTRGI